ncbi:MAG: hypothetical protein OXB98_06515 [Bryobacterales bacterium]|nr:hypothetical protein [Bryobacterales bacterium]
MNLLLLLLIVLPLTAAEFSFDAKWKRPIRPDTQGVLSIGEKGISFRPRKDGKPLLTWVFEDVQHLDRASPTEVAVQSYRDSVVRMGRDRWYRFVLVNGTLSDELYQMVVARIGKPATDRVVSEPPGTELEIPAKHVRLLKGSQGTLYFTPQWIMYSTDAPGESRKWRLDRDVAAVWSSDPYRFEVHALSGSEAFVRRPSVHRFSLKRPLDSAFYTRLKMKLYRLRGTR